MKPVGTGLVFSGAAPPPVTIRLRSTFKVASDGAIFTVETRYPAKVSFTSCWLGFPSLSGRTISQGVASQSVLSPSWTLAPPGVVSTWTFRVVVAGATSEAVLVGSVVSVGGATSEAATTAALGADSGVSDPKAK